MITKTFCVLPWLHAATRTDGEVQLCCIASETSGINLNHQSLSNYWNSDYVKDVRRQMLAGNCVKACEYCYREEAHGAKSYRISTNEAWQQRLGDAEIRRLISKTATDGTLEEPLQFIDLRLGNTCNMECLMCQPNESSRWLTTAHRLSELAPTEALKMEWRARSAIDPGRFGWYRDEKFWVDLKAILPHVNKITIGGGEPFLIKEQLAFVKACCELGEASHIELLYHTNASIFTEELPVYWEQFAKVLFMVSLDGIGAVANYVRYPTDWEQMQKNIARLDALGGNTATDFHLTAHALNVYRIPEVLDWAEGSGFRSRRLYCDLQDYVSVNLVHYPPNQSIQVLPGDYKNIVTERLWKYIEKRLPGQRSDKLAAVLEFMNAEDQSNRMGELVEYTKMLDKVHGTNFLKTFPELAAYWSKYQQHKPPNTYLKRLWTYLARSR